MTKPVYLGIDLGTTNSAAAVFDGEQVTLVRNAQGATLTPSVVRIDARGHVSVGARARRFLESDPENTRTEWKRLMGTKGAVAFPAARVERRPEELAAEILRSLRRDVEEQLGVLPERAAISVPALFELPQSAATSEAARLAGFAQIELIQEPVASAIAAGWSADDEGRWLVYDLGGGTFDASLLETREGFLRVVGHDGDNFLGGRDFDWAIVDWALEELGRGAGVTLSRRDPALAPALGRLKLAAEEAKIDLTRAAETTLALPGWSAAGRTLDVELPMARATLDALAAPLIERTLAVARRLLDTHPGPPLARVVLVGGPTVMPTLRARVEAGLGARLVDGIDPMTVVARGAALYATTARLDARPAVAAAGVERRRLWLQYPAVSSMLTPHVVGKVVGEGPGAPTHVRLVRGDGQWQSPEVAVGADGGFVVAVELVARKPSFFRIEASAGGKPVPVEPASLSIVQGLTVTDPPLSRSIGVATADDQVQVYFERGRPLPARRTFTHHTVETIARGEGEHVLKVPIVQGELAQAHLCRLVGSLEISGAAIAGSLPVGSPVEVTIEVDRGGRLSARALVPALGQVFEGVAHLVVPEADPEALEAGVRALRDRVDAMRVEAFRKGGAKLVERLGDIERHLADLARDAAAAAGGDADAGQKARRTLLEVDALVEGLDLEKKWPELDGEARSLVASAARWVSQYGSAPEQQVFADVAGAVEKARAAREPVELQRQLRLVQQLASAARARHPEYWTWVFEAAVAESTGATDPARAQVLVRDGKKALERGDREALRPIAQELWKLIPADAQTRHLGYDSGVR
jgi:molecular chaperone DnaK